MGTKKSNKLYAAAAALAVTASAVAPGLTADAASKVTVKSVTNPASISHYGGYTFAVKKLSLPKTVKVLLSNKKYENRSVKWGKVSYDKKYIGKYQTISGTVSGTTKKASIKVKLNNYPVDVVEPKLAPVAVGEKLNLPSTIDVKYKDGKVIARSAKSFNLTAEKTDKAGMMKLSYNYMGKNSSIKGSIAYEVKAAEITNVMDSVKEDTLSVSADVKFPAKDAKAQLLIFPGKDESKALPAIDGKLEGGKFTAEGKMIPDGTHSYSIKIGDVVTPAKEFKVDNAVKVESVKATSTKVLTVEFNKAIDTSKAEFEVKKGAVTASVSKITFADDKKSATIELGSKLSKGSYTVNVKGLTEETLSKSVDVEDEKVSKIEILSEVAPLIDGSDVDTLKDDASVAYKVENQYGEDITRFTTLNVSVSKGTATVDSVNGKINLDSGTGSLDKDDKVTVTLIHAGTATTAVKTVTVSSESKVSEVSLGKLYNKDGKMINEDTDLAADAFYIPVSALDQYGNAITNTTQLANDLILNETNTSIVDVAASFTEITIDGKKVPALRVNAPGSGIKVGESTLTLISNTTGKNASTKISVSEAQRTDTITLSQPEWSVVGEDAYIPAQVTDKQGNLVTDVKTLNDSIKGIDVTVGNTVLTAPVVLKDGQTFIKVPSSNLVSPGALAVVSVSSSNKVSTLTLNVRAAAVPTVITGLKSDFSKTVSASSTKVVGVNNLVIEDQYGRVMSSTAVNAWLDANAANKIVITEDEAVTSAVSISDTAGDADISATGETVTVTAGAANGSEKLTFVLENTSGTVQGSSSESTIRVTDGTEYKSYKVKSIGTVYNEAAASKTDNVAYDKDIEVYGVLADGSEVLLTSGYTVTSSNATVATDVADSVIDATTALTYATDKNEVVIPVTVTINATGQQLTQDVTFSKVAPKVESVKVVNGTSLTANAESVLQHDISADGDFDIADLDTASGYNLVVTDQYGVSVLTTAGAVVFPDTTAVVAPKLLITPVEGQMTITNNGLASATVSASTLADKESFNVAVTYDGGASTTIKVIAQP